jgi:hypothetical protein
MKSRTRQYFLPFLGVLLSSAVAQAQTRTVCASGCNHSTIQGAINATPTGTGAAGTTILVHPGTYGGDITLGNRSGTLTNPFIIKAQYAARKPIDGAQWAQNSANRAIINGGTYGMHAVDPGTISNILIDGFYFTGQSTAAIHFLNDDNLWIKNNVLENTALTTDEDYGGIVVWFGDRALIQNNLWLVSTTGPDAAGNFVVLDQTDTIIEYNQCRLGANDDSRGRCWYIAHSSDRTIFRYNYSYTNQVCGTSGLCWRWRNSANYQIYNNFFHTTDAQEHFYVVEENQNIITEAHQIHHNTMLLESGLESNFNAIGNESVGGPTVIQFNIFQSGVNDSNSYAVGTAFTGSAGTNQLSILNNLWWNFAGMVEPGACSPACTQSGNSNTNVTINTTTGCASAGANNVTHGANLDVSSIPYRKCDGSSYPIAGLFNLVPPSVPTSLRILP